MTRINIIAIIIHVTEIIQGGENMKITRELTVNKINVICYDPENKCEITKELVLIGNLTDDQISKEIKKEILESLSIGSETRKKLKSMAWMQKYS